MRDDIDRFNVWPFFKRPPTSTDMSIVGTLAAFPPAVRAGRRAISLSRLPL
jgi:hypothetical protein